MSDIYPRRGGCGRRMIDLHNLDPHTAVGWVEDDYHHFGVTIHHDGHQVTEVRMAAPRTPWVTCAGAALPLRELIGKPLVARASAIGELIDMRSQCTHVHDLSGLVLAQAFHQRQRRRYEVAVSDRDPVITEGLSSIRLGPGTAVLRCNGREVLTWEVDGSDILAPAACAGRSLERGFRAWTEAMPLEEAEYATVLRRAILVAGGRAIDFEQFATAADVGQPALCYTFQPERAHQAERILGVVVDYAHSGDAMLTRVDEVP